ncbi:hypothetical protein INR49_029839 [Caranx melampygus]|nr:hypothetical protein INR49_029839 [Caranx melampygus]
MVERSSRRDFPTFTWRERAHAGTSTLPGFPQSRGGAARPLRGVNEEGGRSRCQGLTSGPTSAADITPPHGSSPPLGVPSRSESPAVTEGDASTPFILQADARDKRTLAPLHGQLFEINLSAMMTEESRGKRRKQANPRRNRERCDAQQSVTRIENSPGTEGGDLSVGNDDGLSSGVRTSGWEGQRRKKEEEDDRGGELMGLTGLKTAKTVLQLDAEQVTSLGSEGEDEVGLWSLEPQDCQESLDKTSLTPSEGTEEPGSPARSTRPHSLSPGSRNYWVQVEPEAEAVEDTITASAMDREEDQEPLRMYCKNPDSQNALDDLAQYAYLAQLKKTSTSTSLSDHLSHNGTAAVYHQGSRHDDLPPAIWSPGAQHHSPEGTGGGRNSADKGSPLASQNQDSSRSLGRGPEDPHQLLLQDLNQNPAAFPSALDLARLWDTSSELSLRASILKGTTLLPYPYAGTKFEQMLQEILHKEVKKDEEVERGVGATAEERKVMSNGGRPERKLSPDRRRESVRSGEGERGVLGHERYLCKMNREAVEVPEGLRSKDHPSPPSFFPRSALQTENNKPCEVTNGLSGNKSPLQKPSWHSVPQQLLVAMHSPTHPRHDSLSSRAFWSGQEKGSPSQPVNHSPELSSPRARRRVPSSGFSSPVCLDLTTCPPEIPSTQNQTCSPWSAQNEPLDLSLPKQHSDQQGKNKAVNGSSNRDERRDARTQHLKRLRSSLSPPSHLALHHHPVYSGAVAPVFPGSLYNGFPIFGQSGLGISGHDGITPIPFSQPVNGPGFLSPMAYMMDTDAEATLKKIHQERQALMGEVLSRGALDYLSLMDEGLEGDGGPGRKRLKKTDEGLYACDICEKTFQKSSSLLRHKYEHTGGHSGSEITIIFLKIGEIE